MSGVFFTSDLHFYHSNIIKYCDRPFTDVNHMNEELISRWNKKVSYNSRVFIIGDVGFATVDKMRQLLFRLKGEKHLIYGNHDKMIRNNECLRSHFVSTQDILETQFHSGGEAIKFVLSHYAMRVWNKSHAGAIHLYGHSHGTLPDDPHSLSMDVGVDTHPNYEPYSLDEVLVHMYKKNYKPIDHHGR